MQIYYDRQGQFKFHKIGRGGGVFQNIILYDTGVRGGTETIKQHMLRLLRIKKMTSKIEISSKM